MSEDQHAVSRQRRVPADVIGVYVSVDQKFDVTVTELTYRGHKIFSMRLEQGVDEQHTLLADKYANVCKSVGSLNHMHSTHDWHDP
jgi:hypothetical protein